MMGKLAKGLLDVLKSLFTKRAPSSPRDTQVDRHVTSVHGAGNVLAVINKNFGHVVGVSSTYITLRRQDLSQDVSNGVSRQLGLVS
jgi:hypothetical protein